MRLTKKIVAMALGVSMVVGLTGCGQTSGGSKSKSGDKITLVYSSSSPQKSRQGEAMEKVKEKLEELSGGKMTMELYYDGTLFAQNAETAAVRNGDCDMISSGAEWLCDQSPELTMISSGYFFKNYDYMTSTLNGDVGKEIFQKVSDEQGVLPLGAWYLGSRQISLSKDKAVNTPADLKGVNLRMPDSDAWMFLGKALGAKPTAVNFSDLYLALQTGTVDGQDNPLSAMETAKFYEVQKSVTITNHVISSVWPTINTEKWNSLTEEQQGWLQEAINVGTEYNDEKMIEDESKLVDFVKSKGLKVYNADIDTFAKEVQDKYLNSDISKSWDMDLYNKIQDMQK